ncbi:MAG: DUF4932 domain-containing protein, partial [Bacillota bacterium]
MRRTAVTFILLLLSALGFPGVEVLAETPSYPKIEVEDLEDSERFSARILPRIELLSGVLLLTSWRDTMGPARGGNAYTSELLDLLTKHREHRAIKTAQTLVDRSFTYEIPMAFALHLEELPDMAKGTIPAHLNDRVGGEGRLEEFAEELEDLAATAEFASFMEAQSQTLRSSLRAAVRDYHPKRIIDWLEEFYGYGADGYHVVLTPAAFPAGGYGARRVESGGEWHLYCIARAADSDTENPVLPEGRDLEKLVIHEWGHSLSDPAVYSHPRLAENLHGHYKPVEATMGEQHYSNPDVFVAEQVLRGVDALARKELYGEAEYREFVIDMNSRGFYLTEMVAEELAIYTENRGVYETFDEFAPILLARMADEPVGSPPPRIHPSRWLPLLLGLVAILGVLWWLSVGLRR